MIYLIDDKRRCSKLVPNKDKMYKFKKSEMSTIDPKERLLIATTNIYPETDKYNLVNSNNTVQLENINFYNGIEYHELTNDSYIDNDILNNYYLKRTQFGKLLEIKDYNNSKLNTHEKSIYKYITFRNNYFRTIKEPEKYQLRNIINLTEKLFYLENLLSLGRVNKDIKDIRRPNDDVLEELLSLFDLISIDALEYDRCNSFQVNNRTKDKILELKKPSK